MTNFFNIIKNVCNLAQEEPPQTFNDVGEPYESIKQYVNHILEEICAKFPWTFRERKYSLSVTSGVQEYTLPDGISTSNIMKKGVRISGNTSPLVFIPHTELDSMLQVAGIPSNYSVFADKIILYPIPDSDKTVQIKYYTTNYALDSFGNNTKAKLELEDDCPIIPDRYIKALEWGVYAFLRQKFKPDEKYKIARDKFLEYLFDMQKQDGFGGDDSPSIKIGASEKGYSSILDRFFDSRF